MSNQCVVCRFQELIDWGQGRDNMLGGPRRYLYRRCRACGSLVRADVEPDENEESWYFDGYYGHRSSSPLMRKARMMLDGAPNALLRTIPVLRGSTDQGLQAVERLRLAKNAHILDVGCGGAELLRKLQQRGFRELCGADPYAPSEADEESFHIRRCGIESIDGNFDLVMFHHSLEHVRDPLTSLQHAAKLTPSGRVLVRIPVVDSLACDKYGLSWAQLDAPRHRWLPSLDGIRYLAWQAGLSVESVEWDSTAFQFWGSEVASSGGTLVGVHAITRFGVRRYWWMSRSAQCLNDCGRGDQVAVVMRSRS